MAASLRLADEAAPARLCPSRLAAAAPTFEASPSAASPSAASPLALSPFASSPFQGLSFGPIPTDHFCGPRPRHANRRLLLAEVISPGVSEEDASEAGLTR